MTPFDYLLNIALIGLVVLQVRGRRLDRRGLVLPLVLVTWAATQYLHGIPTTGDDPVVVSLGVLTGLALGTSAAALTTLDVDPDGVTIARATAWAAVLWTLGIGARMGFSLYAEHGGGPAVMRFSTTHHISGAGWVTGFVLMALVEAASRTTVLWCRSRALSSPRGDVLPVG